MKDRSIKYKIIYVTALRSLVIMLIIYSRENYFDGKNIIFKI